MKLFLILCVLSLTHRSEERSTPEDEHYVAAVVEYHVRRDLQYNLNSYVSLIQQAAAQEADIVVFPELTLTAGHSVPVPIRGTLQQYPVPALQPNYYDEVLVTLSNAARQNGIYVVVNFQEIVNCTSAVAEGENCPGNIEYLFNTNVVFDRNGAVIDRYRKINLFGEAGRTPALTPDLGHFETDFGVRFGHFICFDLMFQVPAVQVVQKLNITDVIFPTMWFSEMPYLTAVQIQEAYAYAMDVNFLGAGANNVGVGSAGSGIFSGKAGALSSVMPGTDTTKLLVQKVPKVPGQVNWTYSGPEYDPPSIQDNLFLKRDPSISAHVTKVLVPGYQQFELTHNQVTCRFTVRMTSRSSASEYTYRAAAFDGVRTFDGVATGGARTCAVYACVNDDIESCGTRFDSYTDNNTPIFEELLISGELPIPSPDETVNSPDTAYFPISLDTSIMPLRVDDYEVRFPSAQDSVGLYNMALINSNVHILSFGIWGRVFERDGQEPTEPNSAVNVKSSFMSMFVTLLLLIK